MRFVQGNARNGDYACHKVHFYATFIRWLNGRPSGDAEREYYFGAGVVFSAYSVVTSPATPPRLPPAPLRSRLTVTSVCGDDERVGLVQEPFVSGADTIIDVMVADIPDAENGFRLMFSQTPFPGCTTHLVWQRAEHGGNWYHWPEKDMEGWLCPALFRYFAEAPKDIYAQALPLGR